MPTLFSESWRDHPLLLGAERAIPSYNVMGVAKAAMEASVRYLAAELGPENRCGSMRSVPDRSEPWPAQPSAEFST